MKPASRRFVELNRDLWEKRTRAHLRVGLYPSAQVESGEYTVTQLEVDEVGAVDGRRLLHLQCNAGADSLYWARRGATVVGVDFSEEAIAEARRLAGVTGLKAEFICSDIYQVGELGLGAFDIVYTSGGVLWWLPDLRAWARLIAEHVADGGFFYIHEIHPYAMSLADHDGVLAVTYDYFGSDEPTVAETTTTYYEAPPGFAAEPGTECGWAHSLGDVVSSLSEAGLQIDYLREHPFAAYRYAGFPSLSRDDAGRWRIPAAQPQIPLTFSLRAHHEVSRSSVRSAPES